MTVNRYPLPGGRELRATRTRGLVFVAVHIVGGGGCSSGPLAVREDELDSLRSALADLAGETGGREATDTRLNAPSEPDGRTARTTGRGASK